MSDNTSHTRQLGYTLAELLISLFIIGILAVTLASLYTIFFDNTLRNNYQARLAVESQGIVEELRISSGIHATSMPDSNVVGGGANWSTSNANLVLIIATPAVDSTNTILFNTNDGKPYLNELVYYASGARLYKRYLVDPLAINNRYQTSCPPNLASSTCPGDVLLSDHFKNMTFDFYDQDNAVIDQSSGDITRARSIQLNIDMEHKTFGQVVTYNNKIRMTMRNNQL